MGQSTVQILQLLVSLSLSIILMIQGEHHPSAKAGPAHTQHTSTLHPQQLGQEQQLIRSFASIQDSFENQIRSIQEQLQSLQQGGLAEDIALTESHFYFKKSRENGGEIVMEVEYLQDSVFENLERQHSGEIEGILSQAKAEIQRLTGILIERDHQIGQYLEQINSFKTQDPTFTNPPQPVPTTSPSTRVDSEITVPENKVLLDRIQQLTTRAQGSYSQLRVVTERYEGLQKTFEILRSEFQTIKNDNIFLVQDIEAERARAEQQAKILMVQQQHIRVLREEIRIKDDKYKELMKQLNDTSPHSNPNMVPNSNHDEIQYLSRELNKLQFDKRNYQLNLQQLRNQRDMQIISNNALRGELETLQYRINQLTFDNKQLQNRIAQHQSMGFSREQFDESAAIEILQRQLEMHREEEKEMKRLIKDLQYQKELKENKVKEIADQLVMLEQESRKFEEIISRISVENQEIKNVNSSVNADWQAAKDKINALTIEMSHKNTIIRELESRVNSNGQRDRERQREREREGQRDRVHLNGESRNKLPTVSTPEELISYSRQLIQQGAIPNNLSKIHSILSLVTNQLQVTRGQLQKLRSCTWLSAGNPSLTVYQQQTNGYIESLLNSISQHESSRQTLLTQNYKLKEQLAQNNKKNGYPQEILEALDSERRLTERLAERNKSIEMELFQLTRELNQKNEQIYGLQSQISQRRGEFKDGESHLVLTKSQHPRPSNPLERTYEDIQGMEINRLHQRIEQYKLELGQALTSNFKLKQHISRMKCSECEQYWFMIQDLQNRLRQSEGVVGQYQRIFKSQEKNTPSKGRINLTTKVKNLKDRTNDQSKVSIIEISRLTQLQNSKRRQSSDKKKSSTRTVHKKHTVLDHLVESEKLSFECLLYLMLKIVTEADNQKQFPSRSPLLPEHIEVLDFDRFHPENMKVELSESRDLSLASNFSLYLAPERLRGTEPTRKSLVWNVGQIFDFMIHKGLYFRSESQIANNNIGYRFQSKEFPKLKQIVMSMLQKQSSKRKMFSHIKNMISTEIVGLQMLRSRGQ